MRPLPSGQIAMRLDIIAADQLSDEDAMALGALDAAVHPPKPPAEAAPPRESGRASNGAS